MPKHNTLMWEITPPPGVSMQQWQTGFRLLFKPERLDEMLMWLDLEVENIKQRMQEGLFYNQPRQSDAALRAHQAHSSRAGKPRPEGLHATHSAMQRRREPRRGTDDAADPDSPPPPKKVKANGNVQRTGDVPMQALTPAMASKPSGNPKISPAKKTKEQIQAEITALQQELEKPDENEETSEQENTIPNESSGSNGAVSAPESETEETKQGIGEETSPMAERDDTEQQEVDLSGPRIHRHRWPTGRYVMGDECIKCGTEATGIEELCPVP